MVEMLINYISLYLYKGKEVLLQKVVYKKYTYKGGKRFGPYLYENKRVNGKVVTRYLGVAEKNSSWKGKIPLWLLIVLGFFVVILLSFFMFKTFSSTGRVSLAIDEHYLYGEQITGNLKLNLKAGELVPRDSKVIVSVGDQVKEMLFSDLISEESIEGNFYAEGASLSGTGAGYGIAGTKTVYPIVDFELLISKGLELGKEKEKDEKIEEKESEKGEKEKEDAESGVEIVVSPSPSPTETADLSEKPSPIPSESVSEKSQPSESQDEKESEKVKEEKTKDEKVSESKQDVAEGETKGVGGSETQEVGSDVVSGGQEVGGNQATETGGQSEGESGITGSVVRENEFVAQGKVTKGDDFRYNFETEETAKVVEGSVKVNGSLIGDDKISLKIEGRTMIVSTDYDVVESGFGAGYNGNEGLSLNIDINVLNVSAVSEKFRIALVYNNVEIVSAEKIISLTTFVNETEKIINETNVTLPELNKSRNVSFVRGIPDFRIQKDSSFVVNLSNYFDGAERYSLDVENISASYNDSIMSLIPDPGFTGTRKGRISAYAGSDSVTSNEFNILVSAGNVSISTYRKKIIVGEPVVWRMDVSLAKPENISLELPGGSRNIIVKKIVEGAETEAGAIITGRAISGRVSAYIDLGDEPRIIKWLKKLFSVFTGKAVSDITDTNLTSVEVKLEDDATGYIIEYVTEGPKAHEEDNSRGKIVVISGPDDLNYSDIIERLDISNKGITIGNISKIKVYWHNYYPDETNIKGVNEVDDEALVEEISDDKFYSVREAGEGNEGVENIIVSTDKSSSNNDTSEIFVGITGRTVNEESSGLDVGNEVFNVEARYVRQEVPFVYNDSNEDGFIDYIEWVVPHLSSQTFEIILISKAEHLDENRTFIEDVYDLVKSRDQNWTEQIPAEHFVRVVFEKNLTREKDITIYARAGCEINKSVFIDGVEVPCEIYKKKLKIDELRRSLK